MQPHLRTHSDFFDVLDILCLDLPVKALSIDWPNMDSSHGYLTRSRMARIREIQSNRICSLPMELLEMIIAHLSIFDAHSLHHTCRSLYHRCTPQIPRIDPHTIETDLSRPHLQQLTRLTARQALCVRELSIASLSGRPLGLGYPAPTLALRMEELCDALERVLQSFENCRTIRISAASIRNTEGWRHWMGALDAAIVVILSLSAIKSTTCSVESITLDLRANSTAALIRGRCQRLEYLIQHVGFPRIPWPLKELSLYFSADTVKLCEYIIPLTRNGYTTKRCFFDFGQAYAEQFALTLLSRGYQFQEIRLCSIKGMRSATLEQALACHYTTLRILQMKDIHFESVDWLSFLRCLKDEYPHVEEVDLVQGDDAVNQGATFTQNWRWVKWLDHQFNVTYTGPRATYTGPKAHLILTALATLAREDASQFILVTPSP
ncbi:uncharacterized protein BO80DRAFT_280868 [Aspergillus ibericus CBS 121593]|uniref:F-box domain-containing protein n=1 Tax=Aspergillus ibericus CBS 121593 TaxID=1448316 RepID=A0A395GJ18_9EURO|nr:hypothetical protein BO80DRAFT_280868 [Aspergillus ibericus CBS 121593]RAK95038.1 hypothetical protein BO80DRAFT_280868 [Aspergillus ibericus CBS 121593]